LVQHVAQALASSGLHPRWLKLEITESVLVRDIETTLSRLRQLKDLGISIAIDDFGTGYSSLAYLKNLSVDVIKIDRSFVGGMGADDNPKDRAIVQSTIGMAQLLGLMVVAEGVETQEALTTLETLGCDAAQGYFLSRPLPALELERWAEAPNYPLAALSA
jgi:EAL domain-containing protein (putative c-di-GMP-specific phosphodiesterase class I)